LGLPREKIRLLGQLDTVVTPRAVIVEAFIGVLEIDSLEELRPDPARWKSLHPAPLPVYRRRARDLSQPDRDPAVVYRCRRQRAYPAAVEKLDCPALQGERSEWTQKVVVYNIGDYVIWGLTAGILLGMIRKMAAFSSR